MVRINTFYLLGAVLVCSANGWVFNNVNYRDLKARNLDIDYEGFNNEIDDDDILGQGRFSLIYPGTKWCGAGDIADSYDDLGPSRDTDLCCREHDHCPDVIPAGGTKYNLTNEAFYSRLSCKCDETFRLCLRKVDSKTSRIIGKMYFNAIGTKCYRFDYPVTGCKKNGGWLNSKCLEPTYDESGEKRCQWFDVPNF